RDESQSSIAEPRQELLASVVGLGRDLEDRLADLQSAARRQILLREVEIEDQAIAEERQRLTVRDQLRDPLFHDGDLHVRFPFLVPAPGIARHAHLRLEDHPIGGLAPSALASPHQKDNPALVLARCRQRLKHLLKIRQRSEPLRVADRVRIDCFHANAPRPFRTEPDNGLPLLQPARVPQCADSCRSRAASSPRWDRAWTWIPRRPNVAWGFSMRVDHLVWYSGDLAAAEERFARVLDAAPAYGGVHPGEGTRNSLLALGPETY